MFLWLREIPRGWFARVVAVAVLAVILGFLLSCQARIAPDRMNLLIIFIDTLRADHLGCYGYTRPTSPNIDTLCTEATLFGNAISQSPWTLPSTASLFTGLYPTRHQTITRNSWLPDWRVTLAEILQENGYKTSAIVSNVFVSSKYNQLQGFDYVDETQVGGHRYISSPGVTERAIHWLRSHGTDPFFLFVHYFDPHHDYIGHPEFPFGERYDGWVDPNDRFEHLKENRDKLGEEDIAYLQSLYDSEIAFTDHHVGLLLDELQRLGLDSSSLVIFTADHGEGFMDHEWLGHTRGLYEELVRVPLVIRNPRLPEMPRTFDQPIEMIDLMSTLLEMLEVEGNEDGIDGVSFMGALLGETPADSLIFSEVSFHLITQPPEVQIRPKVDFRSVHKGRWKLIHTIATQEYELYDLKSDPHERINLAATPGNSQFRHLKELLAGWMSETEETSRQENASEDLVRVLDEETEAQLRALGYVQ